MIVIVAVTLDVVQGEPIYAVSVTVAAILGAVLRQAIWV
jgi:hypothetical protein